MSDNVADLNRCKAMLTYSPKIPVSAAEQQRYLAMALRAAERAGAAALSFFRAGTEVLDKNSADPNRAFDPVTEADRAVERIIREQIGTVCPDHGIYGEEFGFVEGNGLTWVIDPIDGTRGFVTGMLHWGVLIALFDGQTPVLGLMRQPFVGETFFGNGAAAFYRKGDTERALRVRPCADLGAAVLAATAPDMFALGTEWAAFKRVDERVRLTRYGGDSYNYVLLAMGCIDLVVESPLAPYDIQALIPIVRGAGGVITTWAGTDPSMGGAIVAAGDARVHEAALRLLNS